MLTVTVTVGFCLADFDVLFFGIFGFVLDLIDGIDSGRFVGFGMLAIL